MDTKWKGVVFRHGTPNSVHAALLVMSFFQVAACGARSPLELAANQGKFDAGGNENDPAKASDASSPAPDARPMQSTSTGTGGIDVIKVGGDAAGDEPAIAPDFDFTPPPDKAVSFQIDPAHTGRQPGDTLVPPLRRVWSHSFEGAVSYPLIVDGRVFVISKTPGNPNPSLFALDASDGSLLWQTGPFVGDLRNGEPAYTGYDRGRVFVTTDEGELIAVDARTGSEQWSEHLANFYAFTSPPVAAGGVVFVEG